MPLPDAPDALVLEHQDLIATGDWVQQIYCRWGYDDGTRCRAKCQPGSRYCYWHDPETEEFRETGLKRVPASPKGEPITLGELALETEDDVRALLCKVATYLATSKRPDVGRAHALSTTALHLLKSFDLRRLQEELKQLRAENQQLRAAATHIEELPNSNAALPAEDSTVRPNNTPIPSESAQAGFANSRGSRPLGKPVRPTPSSPIDPSSHALESAPADLAQTQGRLPVETAHPAQPAEKPRPTVDLCPRFPFPIKPTEKDIHPPTPTPET